MAHIPYGYRIRNGKAVIEPEEAGRVQEFYRSYIDGLSIQKAKEAAGISVSSRTANVMLSRELYLGDDYYPAIIDQETFDAAARTREERFAALGNHRTTKPKPPQPVRTHFTLAPLPEIPDNLTPEEAVNLVCQSIRADAGGKREAQHEERVALRQWLRRIEI